MGIAADMVVDRPERTEGGDQVLHGKPGIVDNHMEENDFVMSPD